MKRQSLEDQLRGAMRARASERVSVLRLLLAQVKNREIAVKRALNEREINEVVGREIKKRRESIKLFKQGKRDDLVAKEEREMAILQKLLPPPMFDKELQREIRKIIDSQGQQEVTDFGKMMGKVMGELRGKADGERIAQMVKELTVDH